MLRIAEEMEVQMLEIQSKEKEEKRTMPFRNQLGL